MRVAKVAAFILLTLMNASCGGCASLNGTPEAVASFEEASINLGLFPSTDSIHSFNVWLRNDGNAPLHITGSFTSCGCTVASCSPQSIQPGDSTSISITYNAHEKWPGPVSQGIVINSNAKNGPTKLRVMGYMFDDASQQLPDSTVTSEWPVLDKPRIVRKGID